jgi:hypothetical protein
MTKKMETPKLAFPKISQRAACGPVPRTERYEWLKITNKIEIARSPSRLGIRFSSNSVMVWNAPQKAGS